MNSCAWMNRPHRWVGPPSQSPQVATHLTHGTMWNQPAGTANNSCQHRTSNAGVGPTQSAHFTSCNRVYSNTQTSNWQTSAVLHQAVSSQQPAGGETNNYQTVSHGSWQNSFTSPPNVMKANTTYPEQNMSEHWNQQRIVNRKQVVRTQDGNVVSDPQHFRLLKMMLQNVNGDSTKPVSAYSSTTASLPHKQVVCTSTLAPVTAHNRQTAHNQNHSQNGTQYGFSSSTSPPSFSTAVSHSAFSSTTNSPSEHILHISSMTQKVQQFPIHLNSTHKNGEEAKSFTASSGGCPPVYTSSHHRGKQFVSEVRMTQFNQNMQPVSLTVTENYNSNACQSLPHNPGQSLPSFMSRTQHGVPQQSSIPNVLRDAATGDGRGNGSKAADTFFHNNNGLSQGSLVETLSDASQSVKLPDSLSPQRNKTNSSGANNNEVLEILEMLLSVKANDAPCSIHSSPGRTATRAVAVVQPLSQESYQVPIKHTSSNMINQSEEHTAKEDSLSNPEKSLNSPAVEKNTKAPYVRKGSNPYPENLNQMISNKPVMSHPAAPSTVVSSPDPAGHPNLSHLCANDTRSEQAINMQVDQLVAPTAQQSVTSEVPMSQSGDKDKTKIPTDPKASSLELSSLPTVPLTATALIRLIMKAENVQLKSLNYFTESDCTSKLLDMFWDGTVQTLVSKLKSGWYKDLITDVTEFCDKHATPDSVILSNVKSSFWKQLKSYHVLEDNEVYSELPYKSSWLNVNEQLDDIDKEFGFPWSLRHCLHMLKSHSQPVRVETMNKTPAKIASEVPNKVLSQTQPELVDSSKDKQASTGEATSTQTASPNETEGADSSDQYYSFKIQVLPPEEAKIIFEKAVSKRPLSTDADSQPQRVLNSSVEGELPEAKEVSLDDSEMENKSVSPIKQFCCIDEWLETVCGSNAPYIGKCQCKNKQSLKDGTAKTLDKEEMTVQKEDKLCAIKSASKFHLAMEGENQAKGEENIDNQIMTCSWSVPCNQLGQPMALTEDDDKAHSNDKEATNIPQISINSSQSSIILISENKDDDVFSSATEILSDPDMDCVQGQFTSTGSTQSCTSVGSDKEIKYLLSNKTKVASQMSDLEENCGQAQLTSTDVRESSLETVEEQTQISATSALQTTFSPSDKHETVKRKRKRPSSHDGFFPVFKKPNKCKPPNDVNSQPVLEGLSKCRKVLVDATDSESSASNHGTVQLVLFGSAPQDRCILTGGRKRHISSPGIVSDRPPKVLTVDLSPLRRKPHETDPAEKSSVKQWIHEKWRRSFPPAYFAPTKIRCRSKLKTQKCPSTSLSGVSHKTDQRVGPTNNEEPTVSSEMSTIKHRLSLKRRRPLPDKLTQGEEKATVALKQSADQGGSKAKDGSRAVMHLQKNNVLRFSVLPKTFNFKDGSSRRNETNVPNKPALVEGKGKDHSPRETIRREIGTWCPNPKKYCPLRSPPVPKTSSLFQEFQKKYKEKTQPPMDE